MKLSFTGDSVSQMRDDMVTLLLIRSRFQEGCANTTNSSKRQDQYLHAAEVLADVAREIKEMELLP